MENHTDKDALLLKTPNKASVPGVGVTQFYALAASLHSRVAGEVARRPSRAIGLVALCLNNNTSPNSSGNQQNVSRCGRSVVGVQLI